MFDWLTTVVDSAGYLGIALLMFGENVFPPIPSELIMPLAGYHAAQGEMGLVGAILAGSIGSLAGAWLWYWIGKRIGGPRLKNWSRRHGRWLTLAPRDVDRADRWFDKHGGKAVFLGRLAPTVRTLISVPAGVARMQRRRFLLFTAAGTVVWTTFLTASGYMLQGQHDRVADWIGPVSNVVVIGLILIYLYRLATFRPE